MKYSPILGMMMIITFAGAGAVGFPIAKRDCQDRCGDVSVPYPFGIGKDCFHGELFSLECNRSKEDGIERPIFPGGLMMASISTEGQFQGLVRAGVECYDGNGLEMPNRSRSGGINLTRDIFIVSSTANKFTIIGCDTYAYIRGVSDKRKYVTGCMSICDKLEDVMDGSCSGIGCCQTSLPTGASNFNYDLRSYKNYTAFNYTADSSCGHAFVAENDAFTFYAANLTNLGSDTWFPVVVDWVIDRKACRDAVPDACGENSECRDVDTPSGYRCLCNPGFEGNPYLPQGCQDIDECRDRDKYPYPKNATCNNTLGNYTYHCIKGYHHDVADGKCIVDKERNVWPIIIGVGASVGGMSLLALFVCLYMEMVRRKKRSLKSEEFFRKNGGLILQQKLNSGEGSYNSKIFGHEELQKATNNFDDSRIIGRGGFGVVYRGELLDNKVVAIKKSRGVDEHQVEQFINEVMLLSQINSRNVVKLLGCCLETEAPLLVYEFINNGTLFEHLHNNVKAAKLSWNIRLRIASEVAGVLSYLHSVASPPIIHRDIKSENILIDHNYTAKVTDFGISRLVETDDDDQVATMVQGTLGYLDPEYMQTGLLTEKSDVYSFGIVLIELLTGRKVLASNKPEAEKFLSNGFLSALKGNHLAQVLDPCISCAEHMEQFKEVSEIAKRCIGVRGEDRPCMRDVERELEVIGKKGSKQVSVQVFEIDKSKTEAWLEMQSTESGTSTGQYSVSFSTTMDQPLLPISDGR